MGDAEVRFEREKAEGLVAVGSYLTAAAKRFGVKFEAECIPTAGEHFCQIRVVEGADFLSAETAAENESELGSGWRLACHAKIEKPGTTRMPKTWRRRPSRARTRGSRSFAIARRFAPGWFE